MGYPYDKTYLQEIQESKYDCDRVRQAYYVLVKKYLAENDKNDEVELSLKESFALLGEAFELASWVVGDITDDYHFMGDVLEELLTPKEVK